MTRRFRGRTVRGKDCTAVQIGPEAVTGCLWVCAYGRTGAASAWLTRRQAKRLVDALQAWLASTEGSK